MRALGHVATEKTMISDVAGSAWEKTSVQDSKTYDTTNIQNDAVQLNSGRNESDPRRLLRPTTQYKASIWTGSHHSDDLQSVWKALITSQNPITALYQTPEYFEYLRDTVASSELDVITITSLPRHGIVGVVPVMKATVRLPFSVRDRTFAALHLKSLKLLGSEPMVPKDPGALDKLFVFTSERFPESQVVDINSVPVESYLWEYFRSSNVIRDLYHTHVLHGERETHFVDMPDSIETYYRRLTRKRRYNILRQERLLREYTACPLNLFVVENPADLPILLLAISELGLSPDNPALLTRDQYASAALHHILRCFVLKSGSTTIGLVVGMRSQNTYHVDRIFHNEALKKLSPGTTLWQMVLRFLISEGTLSKVSMGYGDPAYRSHATNGTEQRGRVLLFRRTVGNQCRILAHSTYSAVLNKVKEHSRSKLS